MDETPPAVFTHNELALPLETVRAAVAGLLVKVEKARRSAAGALAMAKLTKVSTKDDAELAAAELAAIKSKMKALEDDRLEITRPIDNVKALLKQAADGPIGVFGEARGLYELELGGFLAREVAREREEQARRDAEAEAERARLQAEAGKLRELAATVSGASAEDLHEKADILSATAAVMAPAPAAALKVAGVGTRNVDGYEITDFAAWVKYVANEKPEYLHTLIIDSMRMRALCKSVGDAVDFGAHGIRITGRKILTTKRK